MVKNMIVILDPSDYKGRVWIKEHGDIHEQVTQPDISPSLTQMVRTGIVPSASSDKYHYSDFDDDDEAHDNPDFEKLQLLDPVEKEFVVSNFLSNPDNYEKKKEDSSPAPDAKVKAEGGGEGSAKP